ncbi:hypothetical protein DFJ58DRAFT_650137, partial [Suillus subalutaceus]|uniref:uncharacterized protein n=1 Tax=Suillus subalutaceus TaxID=48586 RepID=UPI001B86A3BE
NAFSIQFACFEFNFYTIFVPDLLHEFKVGIWKATFTYLIHILHAYGHEMIQWLNR